MINMATMAADECRPSAEETKFRAWLSKAGALLGQRVAEGSEDEDSLFSLYSDGCTPSEAVAELNAR
ncbi:hypothetical protein VQ574_21550 (plasmid) [Stutzerimonas frequens]|uniref:hypothetical protein n=1 Tax=Stutzerimonas frequens TaxID=2968969 RepID=UPI002DB7756D|nr:hypothetical protein [Stutzerimonas frequens]WRW29313.1 hypothetical protein VQ574_21550 [Stutzerimonas frequens]